MSDAPVLPLRALVEARRDEIKTVAARHKGVAVALFGSVARGEEGPDSDIDFIVDFGPGASLFDLIHLEDDLAALLDRPLDVVALGGLKDRDDHIRRDMVWI